MESNISLKWSLLIVGIVAIASSLITILFLMKISVFSWTKKNKTKIPMSYHTNIVTVIQENQNFRHVLFTGRESQLVVMSIPSGGEVGKETHTHTEQTLFFLSGTGEGELDGKTFPIGPGDVVVVTAGTEHNFRNTGTQELKIYTVYAPPNHIDGRVQRTKADADLDTADEAVGESVPSK